MKGTACGWCFGATPDACIACLRRRAESAEAELRRLGHGSEVIDVITESGTRFTSYVGDAAWDTVDNRARVRAHHAACEVRMAQAITWLVTVKADQPASIIAHRARLALEALRGKR